MFYFLSVPVDRSRSYAEDDHSQVCDMGTWTCEYRLSKLDNWNEICFLRTKKSISSVNRRDVMKLQSIDYYSLCVHSFVAEVANTCCILHNERSYFAHRCDKFRIHHNDTDLYLHHQIDCKLDKRTNWKYMEKKSQAKIVIVRIQEMKY